MFSPKIQVVLIAIFAFWQAENCLGAGAIDAPVLNDTNCPNFYMTSQKLACDVADKSQREAIYRTNICKDAVAGKYDPPGDPAASCVTTVNSEWVPLCNLCREKIEEAKVLKAEIARQAAAEAAAKKKAAEDAAKREAEKSNQSTPATPANGLTDNTDIDAKRALEKAAEENKRAALEAAQRRREFWQTQRDARENRLSTISAASDILGNWEKALDQNPQASAEERRRFNSDRQVFQKAFASTSVESKVTFSQQDAEKASDVGIRRELGEYADSQKIENWAKKEEKRMKVEEEKFTSMANKTNGRAVSLGAMPEQGQSPALKSAISNSAAEAASPNMNSIGAIGGKKNSAGVGSDSTIALPKSEVLESGMGGGGGINKPGTLGHSRTLALGGVNGKESAGAGGEKRPSNMPSLRELLRKRMHSGDGTGNESKESKGLDKDALDENTFAAGLNPTSLHGEGAESAAAKNSLAADMFQGIKPSKNAFSMHADADGAGRELASSTLGGLLGLESQSLFERVRQAHRSCLARECVKSPHNPFE